MHTVKALLSPGRRGAYLILGLNRGGFIGEKGGGGGISNHILFSGNSY